MAEVMSRGNAMKAVLAKHALWVRGEPDGMRADLSGANLSGADLSGADLDFSVWPLWCGSLAAKIDDKIARQLIYHIISVAENSPRVSKKIKDALMSAEMRAAANESHVVGVYNKRML